MGWVTPTHTSSSHPSVLHPTPHPGRSVVPRDEIPPASSHTGSPGRKADRDAWKPLHQRPDPWMVIQSRHPERLGWRNLRPGWGGLLSKRSLKEGPILGDLKGGDGYMPGSLSHEGQRPGSPSLGLAWLPAMGVQGRALIQRFHHALPFLSPFQSAARRAQCSHSKSIIQ